MILILGGTTEGRRAAATLDRASKPFFYSTRTQEQELGMRFGRPLCGGMTAEEMTSFSRQNGIRLIVDAAHPFAARLHAEALCAAADAGIPIVRFERRYPPRSEDIVWCRDYDDACRRMTDDSIHRLLALTGVQTIDRLRPFWEHNPATFFRILNRDSSREKAREAGMPAENLCYYSDAPGAIGELISRFRPDAIITKESGESGGFDEKVVAAREAGVRVYAVCRPALPEDRYAEIVDGEHGLRRAVERLVPGFFELRTGLTTGTCATAAAKAALLSLVNGEDVGRVSVCLPSGETLAAIPVATIAPGHAVVVKDAGDDPDVTDGARIHACVSLAPDHSGLRFIAGEGVGTVTLPGLGLEPGEAAINPAPRRMMTENLAPIYAEGLDVTISVEGGSELAKKTFNPRVGVVGGISIIGTSGIVAPFSHEAFVEAMAREMSVAVAAGARRIVLNSGAMSERIVRAIYPDLPQQAFIHYGNAVADALAAAAASGVEAISVAVMIAKATKLAEGRGDTHSLVAAVDTSFLASLAREAGCSGEVVSRVAAMSLAREIWDLPEPDATRLLRVIAERAYSAACALLPRPFPLTLHLVSPEARILTVE